MRHNPKATSEIEESMDKLLTPIYIEKKASSNGMADAMVNLVKAAEIFENLQMNGAAEAVTKLVEAIPEA